MTLSIWRYSHWILAIVTSLFILIAAITGAILAVEPISNQLKPYAVDGNTDLSIAELVNTLNREYAEVVSIEKDDNNFLKASVFTKEGDSQTFYLDPTSGEKLGDIVKRAPIYDFATNLHRSLFLKSTGRFLIGLVSFLMILIVITGAVLIAKRQGGFKRWFSKVIKEDFNQYYHVVLGRYALIPLLIIAISGVLLSMYRFEVLPDTKSNITNYEKDLSLDAKALSDFEIFKSHAVHELVSLEYPFSDDEEDYFILTLNDSEYNVNQYTGQILMSGQQPLIKQIINWSFILHTGQGTIFWSMVLLISSLAILFFMFSGYSMAWKRISVKTSMHNQFTKDEAEYVLLVGSETGNTFRFAEALLKSLLNQGIKVFIDKMNNYNTYEKASQLVVLTSTYGEGDAPSGADSFNEKFKMVQQPNKINYSVVGFGSLMYPEYCKYAEEVDSLVKTESNFNQLLPVFKINNQSEIAFKEWLTQWGEKLGLNLYINSQITPKKVKGLKPFTMINKSPLNEDDTFTIQLDLKNKSKFTSGDLLAVYPAQDSIERLYSIGKVDGKVLLSIKRHDQGIASNMLNSLEKLQPIKAKIKRNYDFHFPHYAKEVIMISNGTGIAPFLGMINESGHKVKSHLFWGGRNEKSLQLYSKYINSALDNKTLGSFQVAYSRKEDSKKYVQDLILENKTLFTNVLKDDGVIMICGAIAMQNEVLKVLGQLTKTELNQPLSFFEANEQLKMDCY